SQGLGADGKSPGEGMKTLQEATMLEKDQLLDLLRDRLRVPNCDRIFYVRAALRAGLAPETVVEWSKIDPWFIHQIEEILDCEAKIQAAKPGPLSHDLLLEAKRNGFSDVQISKILGVTEQDVRGWRLKEKIIPTYKSVDTCAAEFQAYTPYY